MGSFYAAWTFSGQEAASFIQARLLDSPTPLETLEGLAVEGREEAGFRQPALLVGMGCHAGRPLPDDLDATELYLLAISSLLVTAPGVRNYHHLEHELRQAGVDQRERLRLVYGDEFDELPTRYGGDDFKTLWDQIAGPLTSRTGWLSKADLSGLLGFVGRVNPLISNAAAREGLLDVEMVLRTAIARDHDVLVLAD